jgi:hypothetical protein
MAAIQVIAKTIITTTKAILRVARAEDNAVEIMGRIVKES